MKIPLLRASALALACWHGSATSLACTTFFLSAGGEMVVGNSLDWNIDDGAIVVNKRNVLKHGLGWYGSVPTWTSKYGSVTVNQWGREFPARGMNEAGLVFGEMQLLGTQYPKADARAPMTMLQWTQYMLDNCATVEEVLQAEKQVRISPDQYTSHFLFADRNGHCVTIEWLGGQLVYHLGTNLPVAALSNDTYDTLLAYYRAGSPPAAGSTTSLARFYNAADGIARYRPASDGSAAAYAFGLLDQVHQPGVTQWKLVFDISHRRVLFHTRKNKSLRYVELGKVDFSPATPVQVLDLNATLAGDVTSALHDFNYSANRDSLITVAEKSGYGHDPSWLKSYYDFPGTTIAWSNPFSVAGVTDVFPGGDVTLTAAPDLGYAPPCQWQIDTGNGWRDLADGALAEDSASAISGAATGSLTLAHATAEIDGAQFRYYFSANGPASASLSSRLVVAPPPLVSSVPLAQVAPVAIGGTAVLNASSTFVNGNPGLTYNWRHDGHVVEGANQSTLTLSNVQPIDAGTYTAQVGGATSETSDPVIVGILTSEKTVGAAREIGSDITAANTLVYDQILLEGSSAALTADAGQIARVSFIDPSDDIVQVEFSGAGTLAIALEDASGPSAPLNYNQAVSYMKGRARIVVADADESTNLSVFSVGRVTAVNQALFKNEIAYDGRADIASIAISSANGKFGGLRAANAVFSADRGVTGIYAPGVAFDGPVYVSDIRANAEARPMLVVGGAADVRITGGDLFQSNGAAIEVRGFTQLAFTAGATSHGQMLPAQTNRATLRQTGMDVTAQLSGPQNR
ncbi:MAG TPA: linear amide C-N hydrolase [Opitutaceae bacterium]|nr:linear amide C-N hydrolase [Opitutaceae bacterium]